MGGFESQYEKGIEVNRLYCRNFWGWFFNLLEIFNVQDYDRNFLGFNF